MRMVRRTDGLLVLADEVHRCLGGMLKCALDTLSEAEIDHKPIGTVVFAGAGLAQPVEQQLRSTLESLGAELQPTPVLCETGGDLDETVQQVRQHYRDLLDVASASRNARRDCGGYEHSPILGASHRDVRPLQHQPDAELAHDRLEQRYSVGYDS